MLRGFDRLTRNRAVVVSCRLALAFVFVYAALRKILEPQEFADAVAAFRILPLPSVNIFAIILPWVELVSGLALLAGVLIRSSGLLLAGMNLVFIAAAASAMARGLDIKCGCFTLSHIHSSVGWGLIARDVVFLLLCLPLLWYAAQSTATHESGDGHIGLESAEAEDPLVPT